MVVVTRERHPEITTRHDSDPHPTQQALYVNNGLWIDFGLIYRLRRRLDDGRHRGRSGRGGRS